MDNPNALKNLVNEKVVIKIAELIQEVDSSFNHTQFMTLIPKLQSLELKPRVRLISESLNICFQHDFTKSLLIIQKVIRKKTLKGFELWPFSEFISQYGLNNFEESFEVMYELTQQFTAEYAIRPFLLKDHKLVFKYFNKCVLDENVHIRRWVSEGTRPLLPWGQKIALFESNPSLTLPFLEKLKYDDEIYVRKSVANHLNDYSKNQPKFVISTLRKWQEQCPAKHKEKIHWITKHALRTLIKKGDKEALKLVGVKTSAKIDLLKFKISKSKLTLGENISMSIKIKSNAKIKQLLVMDYAISFIKKDGKHNKKVFKLKTCELCPNETLELMKSHSLRPITTMKYYSGVHKISLQINGQTLQEVNFHLDAN